MKNILALFGLISMLIAAFIFVQFKPYINLYSQIDPETKSFIVENLNKLSQLEPNTIKTYIKQAKALDPKAYDTYLSMADKLLKTGNSAEATVWKFPVEEGLSSDDVIETMKFVANELNIPNVGELPLYKDISAKTGKEFRYVEIFLYCDSLIAAKMLEYSDSFSAYLPCRIALIEDSKGKLALYSLNMDLMIYGGTPLPPELLKEALNVKSIILETMKRAATGEF